MKAKIVTVLAALAASAALQGCATAPEAGSAGELADMPLAHCEVVTGTRIRSRARSECAPVGYPFRSISAEELEATGETDLNRALRNVHPAFH